MANYRPVDTRLWNDRKFLACNDNGKMLWLFLLTCPSLPIPGVVVGGDGALADMIGWPTERLREGFAELSKHGLQVRREGRMLWLPNSLKYQPPAGPNAITCWGKKWDDVPEGVLKGELWEALRIACKRWLVLFGKLFPKPLPYLVRDTYQEPSLTSSIHEHEHEHEHEHVRKDPEGMLSPACARDPAVPVPHQQQTVPPVPCTPATKDLANRRRALFSRCWQLAGEAYSRAQAIGIAPKTQNGWAGTPNPTSTPVQNLWAIIDGELVGEHPNFERAEARIANRIAVAEAEARAFDPPSARYMTPSAMWRRESFDHAVDMSPEQAAAPRPSSPRAGPTGSAGRAPRVHEHPRLQETLAEIKRLEALEAEEARKAAAGP